MKALRILLLMSAAAAGTAKAQTVTVSGPTTAIAGESKVYNAEFRDQYNQVITPPNGTHLWQAYTGTIQFNSASAATVQWTTAGSQYVQYEMETFDNYFYGAVYVTVASNNPPTPTAGNVTYTYNCGNTVVTRGTSPPSGVEWYWQTTSNGTSTSLGSSASITRTASGNLYLRARRTAAPNEWSDNTQLISNVTVYTTPPAAATVANPSYQIGSGSATVSVGTVAGASEYVWYLNNVKINGQTTNTYTTTTSATTTYQVATKNPGCENSTRLSVTATVYPTPEISRSNNGVISQGNAVTLSVSNFTYDTYTWKDGNGNTIPGATGSSYVATVADNYKVSVTKGTAPAYQTPIATAVTKGVDGLNMNLIVSNTIQVEGVTSESAIGYLPAHQNAQTIQYFDGLGRPIQTVNTQASPSKNDIVQPIVYDNYGREAVKYLPYVAGQDGWYKTSPVSASGSYTGSPHHTFYTQTNTLIARDAKPYAVTVFESSPLNRVIKQGAPGDTWQPDGTNTYASTDHTIKRSYEFNGANEVLLWSYTSPTTTYPLGLVNAGTVAAKVYYGAGQLMRNKTKDEQGHEVIEYTDKQGRVVLKRVQTGASQTINDTNYAGTYYIYDDFGNLVCEIQPEGVIRIDEYFAADDAGKDSFLNRWAFRYKYDGRRRSGEKQIPGGSPLYLVYDKRDRVVMSQDGNQRSANKWSFTKYDALNRPIITGIYVHNDSINQAQMSALISTTNFFDTYNGNASSHGYTNTVFPTTNADSSTLEILSVTYYDNYKFRDDLAGSSFNYGAGDITGQDTVAFNRVVGLVTGTKTNVLGTSDYLWSVNYYDDKYRDIQRITQNHKGGFDRVTSKVDFVGKVLETKSTYSKDSVTSTTIRKRYEYDHAGRLLKTYHQLNSEPEILLSATLYNELGQPVTKGLHAENANVFKQQLDYRYNIRGWITRINNADLNTSDGGPKDYFGIEFGYNNDLGIGTFTPLYNGNISATKWSANLGLALPYLNEPTQRAYTYTYDPMGRLREANFNTKVSSWASSSAFREAMDYDQNGNILSLYRNNEVGSPMDWLKYNYGDSISRSNQLRSVTDQGIITKGFRDRNTSGDDYGYDGNGNLTSDKNKGIDSIKYNLYLDVTEEIVKSNGERIKYFYGADGIKLAEEIYSSGSQTPVKRLDYIGPLVYENDTLKFVVHDEGKVVIPKSQSESPEYQYQVKDHLGNVRLTFTAKEKTDEFQATMEDTGIADYSNPRVQEMVYFGNLFETEIRNVNQWLNHTSNAIGNAIYLDGSEDKTIGPYTILKVYPGDTVKMEVFGKFENESSYSTLSLAQIVALLATPIQTAAIGFEGSGNLTSSSFSRGLASFLGNKGSSSTVPAAYLNYILFDKDFNVVDLGFDRIDESAGFDPLGEATVSFDKMELERIIDRVGYLYVYVSNESPSTRVWMDDVKITYGQSPIVQFEDYYPFGLSQSETAFERGNDKYQGTVTTDGTGLKDLGFRQYDAALGRFHAVDPLAELQSGQSTYQYAGNNPVSQIDVLGLWPDDHDKDKRKKNKEQRMVNGKKVKVHNGFARSKQQQRNERAANQRERQQARADRREQRKQKQEEHAKNKDEGTQYTTQTSAKINLSDRPNQSEQPGDTDSFKENRSLVSSPPLFKKQEVSGIPSGTGQPRFENSVTPPSTFEQDNNGMSPLVYAANQGDNATSEEQYRQYLYGHLSTNEARALYQRMLVSRNYNYQTSSMANRVKENLVAGSNTSNIVASVWDPEEPVKVTLNNGGIVLTHDGVEGILKELSVGIKRPDDLQYNVLEVIIGDARFTEDSPELMQIFQRGADYAEQLLKDEEQRLKAEENRDGFVDRSEIEQFLLSRQDDIKAYMENLRDQVATGDVKDFIGIPATEKQALQSSIDKFRNEQGLDAEVKLLDKEFFERLKKQYENGDRVPEKDVTLLMTRDPQGNIEKHFVYKDGLFVMPTEKEVNGEVIILEGSMEEMEAIRDAHIDKAIDNDELEGVDIDKNETPFLNIFEKGMWVIKVTKETLAEIKVPEPVWNKEQYPDNYPFSLQPLVSGVGDGLIDELKSIPDLLMFGLSMFDKEERDNLGEFADNLSFETIMNMFDEKAAKYDPAHPDVAFHEGGYDAIQIASLFYGGAFLKGGKASKTAGEVDGFVGKIDDVLGSVTNQSVLDEIGTLSGTTQSKIFKDMADEQSLLSAINSNADLVDSWKALDNVGVDDVVRKNPDYLKNIDDYTKRSGDGADEVADLAKNNENGIEQFLDELEDTPSSGHWDKNPFQRGKDIEDELGQNLPETFKTIDKYDDVTGEATSIKSLDLDAKTYQDPSKLRARLNKYLNDLDTFTEASQGARTVGDDLNPVNSKTLELAIPRVATGSQLEVINELISSAATKGINVEIIILP